MRRGSRWGLGPKYTDQQHHPPLWEAPGMPGQNGEGGGPGTRRQQVGVAASRGQEGGEVMGKAAIPAPRLSRLPIKADPKPGRVRMRGRLCCEVCNCSLRPLSQPPDQRPSGHSLSTGKGNKGTAAAAQLPHDDWALTSDLHGPQPCSAQETTQQKPLPRRREVQPWGVHGWLPWRC